MKNNTNRFRFTRPEKSWIMYDWANSVYATNIMAAIFPIIYAAMADDVGDKWYGIGVSIASFVVAVLAPVLGTIGDYPGVKKKLFTAFLVIGVVFNAFMAFVGTWQWMLVGFMLSRIGFTGSCLFYDSFLTDVTTQDRMDKVSGWGYAMGYIGGSTIPFLISIGVLVFAGFDSVFAQKFSILIVSVWWAVFSIPMLLNVHQVHYIEKPKGSVVKAAFGNLISTLRSIVSNPGLLLFLIAYFFYIDGVDTVISVSTSYGTTLGLGSIGMVLALMVTQFVAVPFSILYSKFAEKYGAIRIISIAVAIYVCICGVGFFMGRIVEPYQMEYTERFDKALLSCSPDFNSDEDASAWDEVTKELRENGRDGLYAADPEQRLSNFWNDMDEGIYGDVYSKLGNRQNIYGFKTDSGRNDAIEAVKNIYDELTDLISDEKELNSYVNATKTASVLFWVLAFLVGTVQGGIQALSRSYFGKLIPPERSNEYFGFFDVFAKFAAVIGPLLYSLGYMITGRASVGILSLVILFAGALITLFFGRHKIAESEKAALKVPVEQ